MKRFAVVAALALAACLKSPPPEQMAAPERDRVEVDVRLPKARAMDRVVSAFQAEGLIIASADAGVVRAQPVPLRSMSVIVAQIIYSATVVGVTDSTSRVTIVALNQDLEHVGASGTRTTADAQMKPVTSHWKAMYIPFWDRAVRIGAALQ